MKRRLIPIITVLVVLFCGCKRGNDGLDRALELRSKLLSSAGCRFDADIVADYTDRVYTFSMNCQSDPEGTVSFIVTAPETIAGISGKAGRNGGQLIFNETALAFELLADEQYSPVSAPWLLVHMLRTGYLTSCVRIESGWIISIDDSFHDDALNLTVYLGEGDLPVGAEVSWRGRRILSLTVKNFTFL